jgi:hypothetical protein
MRGIQHIAAETRISELGKQENMICCTYLCAYIKLMCQNTLKLLQICIQIATRLLSNRYQDVFALLVPSQGRSDWGVWGGCNIPPIIGHVGNFR